MPLSHRLRGDRRHHPPSSAAFSTSSPAIRRSIRAHRSTISPHRAEYESGASGMSQEQNGGDAGRPRPRVADAAPQVADARGLG